LYRRRDVRRALDFKHTRHALSARRTIISVCREGRYIVSEYDPIAPGGPIQNRLIIGPRKADILGPHDVKARPAAQEPAHYVVIEVLVCQPSHV
jgi:hypothetical protein